MLIRFEFDIVLNLHTNDRKEVTLYKEVDVPDIILSNSTLRPSNIDSLEISWSNSFIYENDYIVPVKRKLFPRQPVEKFTDCALLDYEKCVVEAKELGWKEK